jgi:hypothetical protein
MQHTSFPTHAPDFVGAAPLASSLAISPAAAVGAALTGRTAAPFGAAAIVGAATAATGRAASAISGGGVSSGQLENPRELVQAVLTLQGGAEISAPATRAEISAPATRGRSTTRLLHQQDNGWYWLLFIIYLFIYLFIYFLLEFLFCFVFLSRSVVEGFYYDELCESPTQANL